MSATTRIARWFWAGIAGWLIGGLFALAGVVGGGNPDNGVTWFGLAMVIGGWSAMLVGIIGKGVELGVRAANDEV